MRFVAVVAFFLSFSEALPEDNDLSVLLERAKLESEKFEEYIENPESQKEKYPLLYKVLRTINELSEKDNWFFKIKGSPNEACFLCDLYLFAHVADRHLLVSSDIRADDKNHSWDNQDANVWRLGVGISKKRAYIRSFIEALAGSFQKIREKLIETSREKDKTDFKKLAGRIKIMGGQISVTIRSSQSDNNPLLECIAPSLRNMYVFSTVQFSEYPNKLLGGISIGICEPEPCESQEKTSSTKTSGSSIEQLIEKMFLESDPIDIPAAALEAQKRKACCKAQLIVTNLMPIFLSDTPSS